MRIRTPTEMIGFQKIKFVGVGVMNARIILDTPKIPPTNAPTRGPSIIAPIITGICIIVGLIGGIGINPNGVTDRKIEIPESRPMIASCLA